MRTEDLEIFQAVVEEGSQKEAARRLGQSRANVNQRIQALERELGGRRLFSSGNSPELTLVGYRFLEFVNHTLHQKQVMERDISNVDGQGGGRVRIGASQSVTEHPMSELVHGFHEKEPRINVDVLTMPGLELVHQVAAERVDIGIGPFATSMAGFTTSELFHQEMKLFAGANHPLIDRLLEGDSEALRQTVLLTAYMDPPGNRPGKHKLRFRFGKVWEVASLSLRVQLLDRGLGVSYLPGNFIQDVAHEAKLHFLDKYDFAHISRQGGLFFPEGAKPSYAVQTFIDYCHEWRDQRAD